MSEVTYGFRVVTGKRDGRRWQVGERERTPPLLALPLPFCQRRVPFPALPLPFCHSLTPALALPLPFCQKTDAFACGAGSRRSPRPRTG